MADGIESGDGSQNANSGDNASAEQDKQASTAAPTEDKKLDGGDSTTTQQNTNPDNSQFVQALNSSSSQDDPTQKLDLAPLFAAVVNTVVNNVGQSDASESTSATASTASSTSTIAESPMVEQVPVVNNMAAAANESNFIKSDRMKFLMATNDVTSGNPQAPSTPQTPQAANNPQSSNNTNTPNEGTTQENNSSLSSDPNSPLNVPFTPPPPPATNPPTVVPGVDPAVQQILDTKLSNGNTVSDQVNINVFKDAAAHWKEQQNKNESPDAISQYYQAIEAKSFYNNGIPLMYRNMETGNHYAEGYSKEVNANIDKEHIPAVAEPGAKDDKGNPLVGSQSMINIDQVNQKLIDLQSDATLKTFLQSDSSYQLNQVLGSDPALNAKLTPSLMPGGTFSDVMKGMQQTYAANNNDKLTTYLNLANPDDAKKIITQTMDAYKTMGLDTNAEFNTIMTGIYKNVPGSPAPVINPATNFPATTASGNAMVTYPKSLTPNVPLSIDSKGAVITDGKGNALVFNQDGTALQDAYWHNSVVLDPKSGNTVVAAADTNYVVDMKGNHITDGKGNQVIVLPGSNAAVVRDFMSGNVITDKNGLSLVVNPADGKTLTDPVTHNAVVLDPATKAAVQVDASGNILKDDASGRVLAASSKTGELLKDVKGNQVQIDQKTSTGGIISAVVVDGNQNVISVNSVSGKPLLDPATGATIILDPTTGLPETVPLNPTTHQPLTSPTTGVNITIDPASHMPVEVDAVNKMQYAVDLNTGGRVTNKVSGNEIVIDPKTGMSAQYDAEKGQVVADASGNIVLMNPQTGDALTDKKTGNQLAIEKQTGSLIEMQVNADGTTGQAYKDPKTGMVSLFDRKTGTLMVDPEGRSVGLNPGSNIPVSVSPNNGLSYVIDPAKSTYVKDANNNFVVIDGASKMPVAIDKDGKSIADPATGNAIVVDAKTGQAMFDLASGYPIQVIAGKGAYVINPATNQPLGPINSNTGGLSLLDADGAPLTDPKTGNAVELDPKTGFTVEVDPATQKFLTDESGNTVLLDGKGNQLIDPITHNAVVMDKATGAPVEIDPATQKPLVEPKSGATIIVDVKTGNQLIDPVTHNQVVLDPVGKSATVEVDANGKVVTDPVSGLAIVTNATTGKQVMDINNNPVVVAPVTNMPISIDRKTGIMWVVDVGSGKPVADPVSGANIVLDHATGLPLQVMTDKATGQIMVMDPLTKLQKTDLQTNLPQFIDPATGAVVTKNAQGQVIDPTTGLPPVPFDIKGTYNTLNANFNNTMKDAEIAKSLSAEIRMSMHSVYLSSKIAISFPGLANSSYANSTFVKSNAYWSAMNVVSLASFVTFAILPDTQAKLAAGDPPTIAKFTSSILYRTGDFADWTATIKFLADKSVQDTMKAKGLFFDDKGQANVFNKETNEWNIFKAETPTRLGGNIPVSKIVPETVPFNSADLSTALPSDVSPVGVTRVVNGTFEQVVNDVDGALVWKKITPLTPLQTPAEFSFSPADLTAEMIPALPPGASPAGLTRTVGGMTQEVVATSPGNYVWREVLPPQMETLQPWHAELPKINGISAAEVGSSWAKALATTGAVVGGVAIAGAGVLGAYTSIDSLIKDKDSGDVKKIVADSLNLASNVAFVGQGIAIAATAIAPIAELAGSAIAPLGVIGFVVGLVAGIIELVNSHSPVDMYGDQLKKEFEGTNFLNQDAIQNAKNWYTYHRPAYVNVGWDGSM